jgi:hypothetical protein
MQIPSAKRARNPFGVQDVSGADDGEVKTFEAQAPRSPAADDANAVDWAAGQWSSRWNGGGAGKEWKQGLARIERDGERFYALFEWDGGAQRGLIEARQVGSDRLVGRYLNLGNPAITRPWVGLIVGEARIDGYWTQGRLDFRR